MELTTVWFVLIAVLWIGYFALEGFDFGVGMLLPVLARDDTRAPRHDQHDRAGLGRQRGVGAGRRRGDVRGVPGVVRDPVQRLLPAAAADPGRPDRARARVRVPPPARRASGGRPAGTARSSSARWCRPCCGAWPSPTSSAGVPLDADHEFTGSLLTLLNPFGLLGGTGHAAALPHPRRDVRRAEDRRRDPAPGPGARRAARGRGRGGRGRVPGVGPGGHRYAGLGRRCSPSRRSRWWRVWARPLGPRGLGVRRHVRRRSRWPWPGCSSRCSPT